jgi:hypothetical protein
MGVTSSSIFILAVDYLRLLWMQFQLTLRKSPFNLCSQPLGLCFTSAMTNHIVSKSLEWYLRIISPHPHIERVVQKEIGQQGADDSSLRCPFLPAAKGTIWHLNRRFQPSPDVENHPIAVGVFPYRSHQKFMVNAVKETLDVEVKHPVFSPAPLSCNSDSFLC